MGRTRQKNKTRANEGEHGLLENVIVVDLY